MVKVFPAFSCAIFAPEKSHKGIFMVFLNNKKFSKLLEDVNEAYHAGRIQALETLEKIKDISTKVVTHTDEDIPAEWRKRKETLDRFRLSRRLSFEDL